MDTILQSIQRSKEQGTKWFAEIRAAIATNDRPTAPKGKPGAKPKYPKTLALAVRLRRQRKTWPEVWEECKKKSQQVGEPLPRKKSAFIRRVQAYIKAHSQ